MASGTGLTSGLSPEEQKAKDIKDQEEWDKTHSRKRISGGNINTYEIGNGGEVETYTLKNGREGFVKDGETYYLNESNGRWEGGATRGANNYYNLGDIETQSNGGGGGGGESPQPVLISGVTGDVGAVATPGVTTEDVLGTQNYNSMNNFQPTAHTMGNNGQTQHLNPLVAAQNWMHQLQPQPTYNPGLYINPGIGLLEDEQQNSIWGTV